MPTLECPVCRTQVTYQAPADVPYRPFCSRRCQFIDLGRWLNEEYRVSEELPPEFQDDTPDAPQRPDPEG
jgi:uncharacterized protein